MKSGNVTETTKRVLRELGRYSYQKKATSVTVKPILPRGPLHWPSRQEWPYVLAWIDTVLELAPSNVKATYLDIVNTIGTPTCEELLTEALRRAPFLSSDRLINELSSTDSKPTWDRLELESRELAKRFTEDTDFGRLVTQAESFIYLGFNRTSDIADGRPRVTALAAPMLFAGILLTALLTFWELDMNAYDKQRSQRLSSRQRRHLVTQLLHNGFQIHSSDSLRMWAKRAYRCYVEPGSIERHLTDLDDMGEKVPGSSYMSRRLQPFRDAVGLK